MMKWKRNLTEEERRATILREAKRIQTRKLTAKRLLIKQSDLEQFLKRLEKCGNFTLAAQRAGVSDEQLDQWIFNDPDASDKIALARYKAEMRKKLSAYPTMTGEDSVEAKTQKDFVAALRWCYVLGTKSARRNDQKIIALLIKNPRISDEAGASKLKITLAAYKMRKKRFFKALFEHIHIR